MYRTKQSNETEDRSKLLVSDKQVRDENACDEANTATYPFIYRE